MTQFYQKGKSIFSEAIKQDENGNYKLALQNYVLGLEHFVTGMKYDRNEKQKQKVKLLIKDYLERAEQIKKHLNEEQQEGNRKSPQSSPTVKSTNKSETKKSTKQEEELNQSIEQAIVKEKPNVSWDEVVGMETPKQIIEEALILPNRYPQLFTGQRKPLKTILLYGPPGTGKSLFAKAVASNIPNTTFFSVSSSDLVSKWQGESEKLVRTLFEQAINNQPSVVFIDEIDAIGSSREMSSSNNSESMNRLKTELLIRIQTIIDNNHDVILLAATNRPYDLDPALRRRLQKRVYIPLPNLNARKLIIKKNIGNDKDIIQMTDLKPQHFDEFAKLTEGYSGADISIVVRDALMRPIRNAMRSQYFRKTKDGMIEPCKANDNGAKLMSLFDIDEPEKLKVENVNERDFYESIRSTKPSVGSGELKEFVKFTKEYGESEEPFDEDEDLQLGTSKKRKQSETQMGEETAVLFR
ncbi:hypothetical protein ABK040_004299 [Willaertia magna]